MKKRSRRISRELPKVLSLGMSYADIDAQIEEEGFRLDILQQKARGVAQVVECVRRNILTEMDGRDLARCVAMEQKHKVLAYTVSQEMAAVYDERKHMHANFNRASFCRALKKHFGDNIRFRQIILDYFWIPQGTWVMSHWTRSFFKESLPCMADLLEQPKQDSTNPLACGVIFLPFCFHCCKHLVSSLSTLDQYFEISFIRRDKLDRHALWSGTSDIEPLTMQQYLGKRILQEDIYCTFTPRDVSEAMDDCSVTKRDVIAYLRQIEDFKDIRMIQLKPLPAKQRGTGKHLGGFVGLKKPSEIERGYDQMLPSWNRVTDSSSEESEEEEEEEPPTPPPKPKVVAAKKKRKPKLDKKPVAKKQKQVPPRKVYSMVEDLESYDLLGTDKEVADYYELDGPLFPDFRRSYLEICNNEHNPKPYNRSMLDLLNFQVDLQGIKPSDERNDATITMLNDETEADLRALWHDTLTRAEKRKTQPINAFMSQEAIKEYFSTVLQEAKFPCRSQMLELTLDQFLLRSLTVADMERFPRLTECNVGDVGLVCKHCDQDDSCKGFMCFVPSNSPVFRSNCLEAICDHILSCHRCPVRTREKLKSQAIGMCEKEREALQSINFDTTIGELKSTPTMDHTKEYQSSNSPQSAKSFASDNDSVMGSTIVDLPTTEGPLTSEKCSTTSGQHLPPTVTPAKLDDCCVLSPKLALQKYNFDAAVQSMLKTEPGTDDTGQEEEEIAVFGIPASFNNWPSNDGAPVTIPESISIDDNTLLEDAAVNVILLKKNKQLYSTFHPYVVDFEREEGTLIPGK